MKVFNVYTGAEGSREKVLEPALPLIDAHHHMWPNDSPIASYGVEEFRQDLATDHNVVATVFAECMAAYHQDGDEALRPVGETEYVVRECPVTPHQKPVIAAGIIGWADLRDPGMAARTLDAHIEAGRGRLSGVRFNVAWHEREDRFALGPRHFPRYLLLDKTFRDGLKEVRRRNLTYDVYMFSEQLPDLAATADAFPDLTIVLCHMGGPVTAERTPEGRRAVFEQWRVALPEVAKRPNVHLKVGGLGLPHFGFGFDQMSTRPHGEDVAALWRPYFDVAVNAFGPKRCMFESNFPPDKHGFSYTAFWNAMKLLSKGMSDTERAAMCFDTARRIYKINKDLLD